MPGVVLILILSLLSLAITIEARPQLHRIGIDDGLPNSTIYDLVQDQQGYIWLATTDSGLLRYDGYHFINVPLQHEATHEQLSQADAGQLLLDQQQRLWVGTWGYGVARLDADRIGRTHFLTEGYQVQALMADQQGYVWVGTTTGLFRITPDDRIEQIGHIDEDTPLLHQRIWSLATADDGSVWIGTSQGIHRWTQDKGIDSGRKLHPERSAVSRQNEVRALLFYDERLWIGSRQGLLAIDTERWQITGFPVPGEGSTDVSPIINRIQLAPDGQLLLGSYEGLLRFDPQLNDYSSFRQHNALISSLNVRSILIDRTGLLWMGTRNNGLFYSRYGKNAFSGIEALMENPISEQFGLSVTSVDASDPDFLWFGTSERLYRLEHKSGSIQSYETFARVNKIVTGAEGYVFIATDAGLFRYDEAVNNIVHEPAPFASLQNTRPIVRDMLVMGNDQIWFGLWGQGVLQYNWQTSQSHHFLSELNQELIGDAVQSLKLMPDQTIWAGTRYSGLFQFDKEQGLLQQRTTANLAQLPSNNIQCIETNQHGELIICTNRGLLRWNQARDQTQLITTEDGLTSNHLLGALFEQGRTWLLSAEGLNLLSPDYQHVLSFSRHDGLTATEMNVGAVSRADNGMIYVGTLNGITVIDPSLIWINQHIPAPKITGFRINHGSSKPLFYADEPPLLQLNPDEASLEIQFSAMDFQDTARNSYQYRLIGFDEEWIDAGSRIYAFYAKLPPGDYEFQLVARNNHGVTSELIESLPIQVLPRWWQNNWLQIITVIFFLLILFAIHLYRLQYVRQVNQLLQQSVREKAKAQLLLESKVAERTQALEQSSSALSLRSKQLEHSMQELSKSNARLEQLNQLKDEFISTVSHELRTPLTSIRGALGLINSKVMPPDSDAYRDMVSTALHNSERLSQLINDLLDVQKFEAGKFSLQLSHLDMKQLLLSAKDDIRQFANQYRVSVTIKLPETSVIILADELRLRQVLDNLLSNAIKFSSTEGLVELRLIVGHDRICVEVEDHGQGIPEDFQPRLFEKFSQADASDSKKSPGTGLGLVICKNIVESHQGKIGFRSIEGKGTLFWFELPY
ncbi:ATP-binding protein [Alkalimonas collagenimarina]|uniref:histidine kinase n=1 Tax=Alkalimonas collagenimarina TaxID=400390 RepID=A0ABT9GWE6_9GAMM|nr:sensor histidine kinase [Alkalimonas collagenimarina]MDP4535379.1 ATP-binding protein [Alkalimonas collagenimarina]